MLVGLWDLRVRTEFDAPLTRQKYITKHTFGPAWSNTALHKILIGYRITLVRLSSSIRGLRNLLMQKFAEAEVANRTADAVPPDPNVRGSAAVEPAAAASGQRAAMEGSTDPVVGLRQVQPTEVSLINAPRLQLRNVQQKNN